MMSFVEPMQRVTIAKKYPELCISAECQNTLKDRVRLTQGKLQKSRIKRCLFTATGLNAATQSDHLDLSENKITQLKELGITLVVFKKIKHGKFSDENSVISYEDFFNTLYPNMIEKNKSY